MKCAVPSCPKQAKHQEVTDAFKHTERYADKFCPEHFRLFTKDLEMPREVFMPPKSS